MGLYVLLRGRLWQDKSFRERLKARDLVVQITCDDGTVGRYFHGRTGPLTW